MTSRPDLDKRAVLALLLRCGKTSREVADFLRLRGHVGRPDDGCACPVAAYLRTHGIDQVNVTRTNIEDDTPTGWSAPDQWTMPTPAAVAEFIRDFDHGVYQDLIDAEAQP